MNHTRRSIRRASRGEELLRLQVAGAGEAVPSDESISLLSTVSSLRPKEAQVVTLRYLLGYSERETADLLRIAPGTVGRYLSNARQALRGQWADDIPTAEPSGGMTRD